jgi:CRISPR-associated protein Cmr1
MEKVTFEVETITPMFLAGNDQFWGEVEDNGDDEPEGAWYIEGELRASSVRGLLRYWQRALVGGVVPTLDEVQRYEQKLFGATDCGSAVTVRLSAPSKAPELFRRKNYDRNYIAESDYLLWSMERSGKVSRGNFKAARYYYPPSTSFDVVLSVKGKGAETQEKLNKAIGTFWLLTQLGGIGSRSRRCAGSLTARITNDGSMYKLPSELSSLFNPVDSAKALQEQLAKGIVTARKQYGFEVKVEQTAQQFDILTKNACSIWVFQKDKTPWGQVDDAMNYIGKSLRDYRKNIKPVEKRKIFGLPINSKKMPLEYENMRMASPLLLSLSQLQNGDYVGIAVLFKALDKDKSQPDYPLIERLIEEKFPYNWPVWEVEL